MNSSRRSFIQKASLLTAAAGFGFSCTGGKQAPVSEVDSGSKKIRRNKIGVSTYSIWQFNGPKENSPIEDCIDKAAAMGFDGVEFLLMQMQS
jgi:L-ribulose-5-phosphate 3-epimerase